MNKNFQDKGAASLSAHGSAQVAVSNLPKTQPNFRKISFISWQ